MATVVIVVVVVVIVIVIVVAVDDDVDFVVMVVSVEGGAVTGGEMVDFAATLSTISSLVNSVSLIEFTEDVEGLFSRYSDLSSDFLFSPDNRLPLSTEA